MRCIRTLVQKKYCWIWSAVDRKAKRFLHWVQGGAVTGQKLCSAIKDSATGRGMTDYWKAYKELLPTAQHIQSKAETFTVEGYNRLFRYFLARLRRQSKCYNKSLLMLEYSVKLLMLKMEQSALYTKLTMTNFFLNRGEWPVLNRRPLEPQSSALTSWATPAI